MSGFGNSPLGSAPFGVGTPATGDAPPEGPTGSRYLNPQTRDLELDPTTGMLAQMPGTRQRVVLALFTLRGSSTVLPTMGVRLPRGMIESFERDMQNNIREALRREVTERAIRIDDILVTRNAGGRADITVEYTDLSTFEADSVSATL